MPLPLCVYLTASIYMSAKRKCPHAGCPDPHGVVTPHTKDTCTLTYDKAFDKACGNMSLEEKLEWVGRQSQRSDGGKAWKSARLAALRNALEEQDLDASDDHSDATCVKLEPSTAAATAEGGQGDDSETESENVRITTACRSASS